MTSCRSCCQGQVVWADVQVDTGRLETAAQKDALVRERAENEAQYTRQQSELQELTEARPAPRP